MTHTMLTRWAQQTRPSRTRQAAWLLGLLSLIAGVWCRFPWKADEPYSFGIAWQMARDGQWLIPYIGETPFIEKPPLVFWLGAASIRLFPFLPAHEAVKIASMLLVAIAVFALLDASRTLLGRREPTMPRAVLPNADHRLAWCVLLFAGSLGLIEHTHKFLSDNGQLAGAALALAGLVRLARVVGIVGIVGISAAAAQSDTERKTHPASQRTAGLLMGTGMAMAFLSKGLLVPLIVISCLIVCLLLPAFRVRAFVTACGWAALPLTPAMIIWPAWLWIEAPALFWEWLLVHNIGRFTGATQLGGNGRSVTHRMGAFLLASCPAALIVLHAAVLASLSAMRTAPRMRSLWQTRHALRSLLRPLLRSLLSTLFLPPPQALPRRAVQIYLCITLLVLLSSSALRSVYFMPAVLGWILLATAMLTDGTRRRTSFSALPFWFSWQRSVSYICARICHIVCACLLAGLMSCWVLSLINEGAALRSNLFLGMNKYLPLASLPSSNALSIVSAVLAALSVMAWWKLRQLMVQQGFALCMAGSVAVLWSVSGFLFTPWIDAGRSYKAPFATLAAFIPQGQAVAVQGLGESERALFEYVAGRPLRAVHLGSSGAGDSAQLNPRAAALSWLVVQDKITDPVVPDPRIWRALTNARRAGHASERFTLYERHASPAALPV